MITSNHLFVFVLASIGCKNKIKETEDSVYSRHLQRHVKLTILNTFQIVSIKKLVLLALT
ncbi:MAG TPA: hypothetical protein VIM07_02380 [Chitinophagaceae bacterium]